MLKNIKEYVANEKQKLKDTIATMDEKPKLTIFQVGDNPASNRYVRNKLKDAAEVGIEADLVKPESQEQLEAALLFMNHPVIVQLPLPDGWDVNKIINSINPELDVDGFVLGSKFTPCTPKGIMDYLDYCDFNFKGQNAVVLGRSEIVGRPIAKLLLDRDCTVTMLHSKSSEKIKRIVLNEADLVICAVGRHGVLHPSQAPNAVIVDVGINFDENGKLVGDVEFVGDVGKNRTTPVPGGVGLTTRLALMQNTVEFYKK